MVVPIKIDDKKIPKKIKSDSFVAEVLSAKHAEEDLVNVINNEKLIKATRGGAGTWPNPKLLTLEENRIDLSWHQREFEYGLSFAYLLRSKDGKYMGCAYLYPVNFRSETSETGKYEVDFSFWIVKEFYDMGLYEKIKAEWLQVLKQIGFKKIYYSNRK